MKGSSSQGDTANNYNDDNNVDGGSAGDANNTEEGQQQIIEENNDNDNNNVNIEEEEEEEPETQESFTQHEMTQTGNELTQISLFDDDDDDDNCNGDNDDDQDGNDNSRQPMIDPLTLPWGRLMPVGSNEPSPNTTSTTTSFADINGTAAATAAYTAGPLSNDAATTAAAATTTSIRPSTREAIEMLPKSPETKTITRSSRDEGTNNNNDNNYSQDEGITFLGLKNLVCSDRFNEYVLGRSVKADITAQKLDVPSTTNTTSTEQQKQLEEKRRKSHDYIHAMISNRHCRIYCLLNLPNNHTTKTIQHGNNNNHHHPEMEVFVEDTSGNGTLINGTTLLRKNERRKLHTGDVICLLNPKLLYKKIRNGNERKRYMQQYSYVFVNLYEQERHWNYNYSSSQSLCGVGGGNSPSATSSSSWNRKGGGSSQNSNSNGKAAAVNPRATRCHSTSVGSRDDLTRRKVGGGNYTSNASATTAAAGTNTATAVTNNDNAKGTAAAASAVSRKQSLGSFLNNQSSSSRRRVEDEYDLRDLLGTGTCGEVRRAIHRRTGDERAVKIISITERGMGGANFFSKEKLSSIQAEAEILRSLDHPYVVKLFDVFVAPGKAIYLVMELIKGGDLFDRIVERERYTEVHARRLFRRILAAVHYLHEERGVVHRDLKPENILVVDRRSDVDIKLTDFGLAKNLTAEGLKTFCGTPQYFAPEVLRRRNTVAGNGRYGKEIDCWSIGVILFILLSGSPPFDVSAGFDAVASANVIFYEDQWKHISKDARDLVRRLLEKDAKKRMSVKDACEHPWLLVDDGDTHCHPLQDPVVTPNAPITKSAESEPHVEPKDKNESLADAQVMPAPPPQIKDSDKVAASEESPKPATKKRTRDTFLSKSAPQLSKIEHKKNSNSKFSRKSSLLHDSEALQHAVDIPEQKSPTSPLSKKLLFAKPSNEGSVRKMSKQNVEQIKTAGNTLPKPSLSAGSRLLPKKKIQQQLGENFKKIETTKAEPLVKPAVQFSSDKENGDSKKWKQSSSTVTPPGQEQTLVFRLNKKRKTGKNVNAEEKEETGNSSVPPPKAELSEDELQSDFSDDEGDVKPRKSPAKKRKIEEFLHKKKSESIQSSASIESLDSKSLSKSATTRISLSPNLGKNPLASQECETKGVEHASDKPVERSLKSKKKKQTFLFGKPPPSGFESTVGIEETVSPTSGAAHDSDQDPTAEERGKESVELERQPSSESMTGQATISSTKGTQKSIKNWFQPKK